MSKFDNVGNKYLVNKLINKNGRKLKKKCSNIFTDENDFKSGSYNSEILNYTINLPAITPVSDQMWKKLSYTSRTVWMEHLQEFDNHNLKSTENQIDNSARNAQKFGL